MTKRSMTALLTIFLSLIMVQVSAASAFQESLHDIGIEIAHSQHSSEDHANGDCFNGELVNHLADELLNGFVVQNVNSNNIRVNALDVTHHGFVFTHHHTIRGPPWPLNFHNLSALTICI